MLQGILYFAAGSYVLVLLTVATRLFDRWLNRRLSIRRSQQPRQRPEHLVSSTKAENARRRLAELVDERTRENESSGRQAAAPQAPTVVHIHRR